jgi:hypothetical protein
MTKTQVAGLETVDFAIIGSGLFNSEQVSALSATQKKAYLDAGGTIGGNIQIVSIPFHQEA